MLIFFASSFVRLVRKPESRRDTRRMWQGMTPECDIVMKGFTPTIRIVKTSVRGDWSDAKEQGRSLLQS